MKYMAEEKRAFQVLGIRMTIPYGGAAWAVVKSDGTNEKMKAINGNFLIWDCALDSSRKAVMIINEFTF